MNHNLNESGKGTYILWLRLDAPTPLTIGKLGTFDVPAGYFAYVGSAFGPGGLAGRLKHHLNPVTRPHWHIDYLRQAAAVVEVWYAADPTRWEHHWAATLQHMTGATIPVARFGASDCDCAAHLFHFEVAPSLPDLRVLLAGTLQICQDPPNLNRTPD